MSDWSRPTMKLVLKYDGPSSTKQLEVYGGLKRVPKEGTDVGQVKIDLHIKNGKFFATQGFGATTAGIQSHVDLWREDNEYLYVPRHYEVPRLPDSDPLFRVDLRYPYDRPIVIPHSIKYRDESQQEAVRALLADEEDKILCLACGKGKSFSSLGAASEGNRFPLLIVVHTNALMDQWRDNVKIAYGLKDEEIGHVQGPKKDWEGKKVVIAMLHSLTLKEYPPQFYVYFRLVISDECFPAGTLVDGRRIEDIRIGDTVTSFDPESGLTDQKLVTHVFVKQALCGHLLRVTYDDGRSVVCTPEHPFFTHIGWVPASSLRQSDACGIVVSEDERVLEWARVESIEIHQRRSDGGFGEVCPTGYVYNLEVADYHTYTANGVVVHNCHRLSAELFSRMCEMFPCERWGLTATVEREDGMSVVFKKHFGNICYQDLTQALSPIVFFVKTGVVKDSERYKSRYGSQFNLSKLITDLADDDYRNLMIADRIRKDLSEGRTILVLGERISQLHFLHDEISFESKSLHIGAMKAEARKEALTKKLVFATHQLAKEGLDRPAFDTLYILIPFGGSGRLQQSLGRILRTCVGKKQPIARVFVDDIGIIKSLGRKMSKWLGTNKISFFEDKILDETKQACKRRLREIINQGQ
jgi:superfamily II DNA or RNA helicase